MSEHAVRGESGAVEALGFKVHHQTKPKMRSAAFGRAAISMRCHTGASVQGYEYSTCPGSYREEATVSFPQACSLTGGASKMGHVCWQEDHGVAHRRVGSAFLLFPSGMPAPFLTLTGPVL
jgi:hypothetical protein